LLLCGLPVLLVTDALGKDYSPLYIETINSSERAVVQTGPSTGFCNEPLLGVYYAVNMLVFWWVSSELLNEQWRMKIRSS
jgi:hypothetical protein